MSRQTFPSEPGALLRQLAQESLPAPQEDASPARRERLVRSLKESIDRTAEHAEKSRRFRRGAAVVAVAACLSLLGGSLLRERVTTPLAVAGISGVSGTVVLTQDGRGNVVASGERELRTGDALQTAAGARAHVKTIKASVDLSESTDISVSRPSAAEERISLRRGRVDVSVTKAIETQRAVVVETPDAEVVVRGTVFDVRVEPHEGKTRTFVHVTHGSVWVLSQGVQVALLSAGQTWSSGEAPQKSAPKSTPTAQLAEAPKSTETAPSAPAAAARGGASKNVVGKRPGTLAEENRLFAAGIEARNRGDSARAAELFAELLATYPQSTLREVAQVERFRALKGAGQASRASTEARRYLAEHPNGAARSEARDLALDPQL